MVRWGFIYSIDFVGGTNLNYELSSGIEEEDAREVFDSNEVDIISLEVDGNQIVARTKAIDEKKEAAIKTALGEKIGGTVKVLTSETVGPTLGRETLYKTLIASGISILVILGYMSFAFGGFYFALAAIIALFHDLLVVFGSYSLLARFYGAEIDTMFVTAILISMALSVHDTIIIFDKVREYLKSEPTSGIHTIVNKALTDTMVRSMNNSMTNIFMLLSLVLLGGSTIRFFTLTLLIGTITGTYSSPFIAAPILAWLKRNDTK